MSKQKREFYIVFAVFIISCFMLIYSSRRKDVSEKIVIYQSEDPLSHLDIKEDLTINSHTPMIIYPVLFSWICILMLTISKSIFIFGYPILVKALLSEEFSYLTYLIQGGLQLMQLIGLTWINSMKIYSRKLASLISIIAITIVTFTIVLFGNIWYISIISAIVGLFLGLIHGVGLKIMLEYGTAKNTSKYATINEIIIGVGFGLTPIIAGYVIEIFLFGIHWFLTFLSPIMLIFLIFLSKNIKREKNNL